jgi:hypothetical protein
MGDAGEMVVVTVTAVPCSTVAGETLMVAMLGRAAAPMEKDAGAETEAWYVVSPE